MTRSTGTSGLIFWGSPPSEAMASRIAARSTTAGTPVKSCISTRAGRIGDLDAGLALVGQPAGDRLDALLGDRAAILVAQAGSPAAPSSNRAIGAMPAARSSRPP